MAKAKPKIDVLVLGDHPAAYFAAALLRENPSSLRVLHCTIPGEKLQDRIVVINPQLFDLHKLLGPLKRKLTLSPMYGLRFLGDDPQTRSEWLTKTIVAYAGSLKQIHAEFCKLAERHGAEFADPKHLEITGLDEQSLHLELDGKTIDPRLLLLAGELPAAQKRMLGLNESWESDVMRRYTFVMFKGASAKSVRKTSAKPLLTMSLDLRSTLWWAWMIPSLQGTQLAVEQPLSTIHSTSPKSLLEHWANVLVRHGELSSNGSIDLKSARSIDLPLAGALTQEGVANRTLLFGPAGGFYNACGEDIYPNTWSALFAVQAAKKALKERHAQDALHVSRQQWGSTLGDFLRGPQQNLRFLLPLVYRNPMMSSRLAEAILLGKSVVR